ncbi:MAG: hypothetical protein IPN49_01995 [Saprospiraceae bacterium]|nr:hypothetical protein [Saprospiraceae bacterium]
MRVVYIFLLFLSVRAHSQDDWTLFLPEDRSFQVLSPGTMDWGVKHVLTDLGELKTITYLNKGSQETSEIIYIINYTDYPGGILHEDSTDLLENFFQTSLDGIIEKLNGQLLYYADVSTVYSPKKLYKINYNDGHAVVKGKMYILNDRFIPFRPFLPSKKVLIRVSIDFWIPLKYFRHPNNVFTIVKRHH